MRKRKPEDCCGITYLRYALFVYSTLLFIVSGSLLGYGTYTLIMKHEFFAIVSPLYQYAVIALMLTGSIALVMTLVGCYGTAHESYGILSVFAASLIVIFFMEVGTGVLTHFVNMSLSDVELGEELQRSVSSDWMNTTYVAKTKALDQMQEQFKCCGVLKQKDWESNLYIQESLLKVPDSCCISPTVDCGMSDHPNNIYYRGCLYHLADYMYENSALMFVAATSASSIQIFGIVLSIALALRIKDTTANVRKYNFY